MHFVCATLLLFTGVFVTGQRDACVTPNGENAMCISINSCPVIKTGVLNFNQAAIEFAKKSACGYQGTVPLVCCGSTGRTLPKSTPKPPTEEDSKPAIIPIDSVLLPDHSLCGIQVRQDRTIGKDDADIDEFPWVAAIKYVKDDGSNGGFLCAGTLINQRYVLTAAQCLYIEGVNISAVRLGEWKFDSSMDCGLNEENGEVCTNDVLDVAVAEKITHPYYNKKSGNNDIALLRLNENVLYTDFIRPICLPANNLPLPAAGSQMEIAGWGITENGDYSDVKLKVRMVMVGDEECSRNYFNYTLLHINQACTKIADNKKICSNDSGIPLMRTYVKTDDTEEEQWYQEGIVYKELGCRGRATPSLYTRVSRYTPWILNTLH